MKKFKISLAAARVNAELTQEQVAKSIGVSKNTIFSWEKGISSPKADQVDMLCKLYNVPFSFLRF